MPGVGPSLRPRRPLAGSTNGKWIMYTQIEQSGGELMLVENFR